LSEQTITTVVTVICGMLATIATLWYKARTDRLAHEKSLAELAEKNKEAAAVMAKKVETTATTLATKADTAVDTAAKAVEEVMQAVNGIDKIRVMVDGQRTAMMEELKAQAKTISNLEKVIMVQQGEATKTGSGSEVLTGEAADLKREIRKVPEQTAAKVVEKLKDEGKS
jgi:hypothetical protein